MKKASIYLSIYLLGSAVLFAQKPIQELFTVIPATNASVASQQSKVQMEKMPAVRQTHYVSIGNLATIQKNAVLTFTIPGSTQEVTFEATNVDYRDKDNYKWIGREANGYGTVIFLCENGNFHGTFSVGTRSFQLFSKEKGVSVLMEIDAARLPAESCPTSSIETTKVTVPPAASGGRQVQCQSNTRVLFLHTNAAAAAVPNINQVVTQAVEQFNNAQSFASYATFIVSAGVFSLPQFVEGTNIATDMGLLSGVNPDNGNAVNSPISTNTVIPLRNQNNADIVVLLTDGNYNDGGTIFGMANDITARANTAYAIVEADFAANTARYTFAHEMGHLFGGRHDADNNTSAHDYRQYSHGYRFTANSQTYQTLMHRIGAGQSRILQFSNPNSTFQGAALGTVNDNDVMRTMREFAPAINQFRSSPASAVSFINGPSSVTANGTGIWEAYYSCDQATAYLWTASKDGITFTNAGTGETVGLGTIRSVLGPLGNVFFLRLRTNFAGGVVTSDSRAVSVQNTGARLAANESRWQLGDAFPNPTTNQVEVPFTIAEDASVQLTIQNMVGITLSSETRVLSRGEHTHTLDLSKLPAGLYVYTLTANRRKFAKRLVVVH